MTHVLPQAINRTAAPQSTALSRTAIMRGLAAGAVEGAGPCSARPPRWADGGHPMQTGDVHQHVRRVLGVGMVVVWAVVTWIRNGADKD